MINADFRDTRRYHGQAEPADLLADLKELGRRSELARSRRILWIVLLVLSVLMTFFSCPLTLLVPWVALALLAGLVGAVVFAVLIYRAGRVVLDERRRKLAAVVVRALACDLPPAGTIDLAVDFNDYQQARFLTDQGQVPNYLATSYRQPWLAVSARLADGTRLELGADLVARRKERAKSKGRKKIKEDLCEHVRLSLQVPALPAGAAERWPQHLRAAPLPEGAHLQRALVKKDRLLVEVQTHRHVRVTNKGSVTAGADIESRLANRHTLLMPVLAAYHALAGCRGRA